MMLDIFIEFYRIEIFYVYDGIIVHETYVYGKLELDYGYELITNSKQYDLK